MYIKSIKIYFAILRRLYFTIKLALVLRRCKYNTNKQSESTVVMESIRDDMFYNVFSFLICYFISQKVSSVYILKDDGMLKHHDIQKSVVSERGEKLKGLMYKAHTYLAKIINLPLALIKPNNIYYIKYSQIYNEDCRQDQYLKEELRFPFPFTKHIDASHKRFFGGREFNPSNESHVTYAKISHRNEIINKKIGDIVISQIKPDLYISLDGIYTTFGPIVEKMKINKIPVLLYQVNGFRDRSIFIGEEHYSICNCTEHWYNFKKNTDNAKIKTNVELFLDKRLEGRKEEAKDDEKELLKKLTQYSRSYEKTIVLFPNLTWDGAIKERDILFDGLLDWMIKTIEWVKNKPYFLIIREHPMSKEKYNKFESSLSLLKEYLPDVENIPNVYLISGLDILNSYRIVENIADCSVVYNGTLGIEIAYLGCPVVFAGNSPYSGKGVGYEPESKYEYYNYLNNIFKNGNTFQKQRREFINNAIFSAAYQFENNSYYCPIIPKVSDFYNSDDKYWQSWDLSLEDINPIYSPEWNRTINRFLSPLNKKRL